uniref:Mitochondrial inner membrane protease subunit 2 n=1 Tax=Ornithorhynchus anatinus TaxID=9258 RepID=A0A6I8PLX1_ORNAN
MTQGESQSQKRWWRSWYPTQPQVCNQYSPLLTQKDGCSKAPREEITSVPAFLFQLCGCSINRSPKNPEQKIIKRVIALEGDIIKTMGHKNRFVKVPRGHIWVEGDHHGHSFDSNTFGPVSLGLLHAQATHILWPPQRWQKLYPILPPDRVPIHSQKD